MTEKFEGQRPAGLFHLPLIAEGGMPGAPTLHLNLGIDTVQNRASGFAEVTQALADPIVNTSNVHGPVIYETIMGPGSKIRVDLTGYPAIHMPPGSGIGPQLLPNFKATLVMDTDWQQGEIVYQYQSRSGEWINPGPKKIHIQTQQQQKTAVAN